MSYMLYRFDIFWQIHLKDVFMSGNNWFTTKQTFKECNHIVEEQIWWISVKLKCSEQIPPIVLKKMNQMLFPASITFFQNRYRFGTEFGAEDVAYGCDQQRVELLAQAKEMTEGEDNHLFGMSVQPLSYLHENALPGEHKRSDCGGPLLHASQHWGGIKLFYMGLMMEKSLPAILNPTDCCLCWSRSEGGEVCFIKPTVVSALFWNQLTGRNSERHRNGTEIKLEVFSLHRNDNIYKWSEHLTIWTLSKDGTLSFLFLILDQFMLFIYLLWQVAFSVDPHC